MKNKINSEDLSFSILMANYNNADYIEDAIKSVISQTYSNWELIIVDDCSTDDSVMKIKPFLIDKRINLICHERNLGYGGTLKNAAENAQNHILGIFDADDMLHEKALEKMVEAYYQNPGCGFLYSTYWKCNSELKDCKINKTIGPIIPKKTSIFSQRISHFKTFRKEAYKLTSGFDPNQKRSVDKDIIFKLEEVTKFKYINIPLYYHRLHQGGISQGKNRIETLVYHYSTSCKTYKRRLGKQIPNFTLEDLYMQYLKITFYSMNRLIKHMYKLLRISILSNRLSFIKIGTKIAKNLLLKNIFKLFLN